MSNLSSTAATGTTVTLAAQGARFGLQMLSLVVLSRLLTPEDFGLVAMVTALLGVAEIIRDFGLSSAAIQSKTLSANERTNLFWVNVGIGLVCTIVAVALTPMIVRLYGVPSLASIVLALSWLFVVSGANTQFRAELTRDLRFGALAVTDVVAQSASVAVAITLAARGAGYWAIVGQQVVLIVATLILNVLQCRWRPGWPRRGVEMGRFFRYGAPLLGMQTLGYATNNIDNVAIGAYWGNEQLGLYSRAYQLMSVPLNQIGTSLTRITLPVMSRVQDDDSTYRRYVARSQLAVSYLFGSMFALAAGLAVPIVAIVLGRQWGDVAPIFAVLAVGGIFRGFGQVTYWIVLSRGLTGRQLQLALWIRPIMIASILCGLPWGALGVAVGHSVAFMIEWSITLWWIGRWSGIPVRPIMKAALRSVLIVSGPAGLLAYCGTVAISGSLAQFALGLLLGCGYMALVGLLSPRERADARIAIRMARKALSRA